jgi:hypothetical protein
MMHAAAARRPIDRRTAWRRHAGAIAAAVGLATIGGARVGAAERRCTVVECYVRATRETDAAAAERVRVFARDRGGIIFDLRDIEADAAAAARFERIRAAYARPAWDTPLVYVGGRAAAAADPATLVAAIEDCLQIEVFTRQGCARCTRAKEWLPGLAPRYPGWRLVIRDLSADAAARGRLTALVKAHRTTAASVPVIHLCGRLVIGFDAVETTGRRIEDLLTTWSRDCPDDADTSLRTGSNFAVRTVAHQAEPAADPAGDDLPIAPPADLPLPDAHTPAAHADLPTQPTDDDGIDLPWLGRLDRRAVGMPLFTIAVGLVDGFNPCAMWVLIFLLSILVNLRDRVRMVAIAGTFVLVSGLAYLAFMAAWLNVFLLIGYLRPVQVLLGIVAITVGTIHVKDFFAFKQGVSLSIPESAKPGIYQRVRGIVSAENLPAALAGAFTLAVLVNIVELLCTAGLPALYTNILMQQGYSAAGRYGYLLLYVLAYMFDDALMVGIVVATLSRRRLQETEGRWLKLISGLVILALGLVMIVRPEWLA